MKPTGATAVQPIPLEAPPPRPSTGSGRPERAEGRAVPFQCKDCARVFEPVAGEGATRCPHCGSIRCGPTRRRVAGSLLSADNPLDQDRFARLALWGDLITSDQFAECVEEQKARAATGRDVPSLVHLLIERGYLRREHADAVLKVLTTQTPEQWRNQLGQIAVRRGFVTEDQLRECLELQTKLVMSTGSAPFLGHLLIESGYMTEAQVLAILKAQEQHHLGVLHDLERAVRPAHGRIADFLRARPRLLCAMIFVVAVGVAGVAGAWLQSHLSAPPTFDLICSQCGHRARAVAKAIEQPCPWCGRGELCTPLWCAKCRVAFPLRIRVAETGAPWVEGCPLCGTLSRVALPPGIQGLDVRPRKN